MSGLVDAMRGFIELYFVMTDLKDVPITEEDRIEWAENGAQCDDVRKSGLFGRKKKYRPNNRNLEVF